MKHLFPVLLLMIGFTLPAMATEKSVTARVTDVVVYIDRAQVTRKGTVDVAAGVNRLRVPIDAFAVDPDAVTATVDGRGELLAVQYLEMPITEASQEKIRTLEARIENLKQERRTRTDERNALQRQDEFLRAIVDFSKTQIPVELKTRMPTTEELGDTITFLDEGFSRIYQKIHMVDQAIVDLDKNIRQLERELQDLRQPGQAFQRLIEIQFNADIDQKVDVTATYVVSHASWSPAYRAAVPQDLSSVDLTLFARIVQKTGEDWQWINLSVSNVVPLSGSRVPEVHSWWLDVPRPKPMAMRKSAGLTDSIAQAPMSQDALEEVFEAETPTATFAAAARRRSELAFEYAFKETANVESGQDATLLPVFTRRLEGDFYRYAVPRQSALTYLICETEADSELLSGPLNVYFSGRYVGKMTLEEKKPGATFRIGLGADREVLVKREKVTDRRKETFFGKIERDSVVLEQGYRIIAENLRDKALSVKIVDSIPVSRTDRIKVDEIALVPPPDEKNLQDREGVMAWKLSLAPGEKKTIDIRFTLVYPKDAVPTGL
ncbi:MAG: mucoidy inhibitor MuiA family protein [Deltaproteobacteria bacterium]|nr:mucoidy inhibitor MuiA family protein [Deltaproteobacteria bacterium]